MAITPGSLADGQLPNAKGTLYTCPALTAAVIRSLVLVNTGAGINAVNLYLKRSGGTSRRIIAKDLDLATGVDLAFDCEKSMLMLSAGDVIEGDATTAAEVDYSITGFTKA